MIARACALPKNRSPQRKWSGTTSCASRPSAGIDRAKCLISLKVTGEQGTILSTVGRGGARRPRPGEEVAIEMLFGAGAPARNIKGLIFLGSSNLGLVGRVHRREPAV